MSASRGAYLSWLVSVFSLCPSALPSRLLSRLPAICLLEYPPYLDLYLDIIDPDHFHILYIEYFQHLSRHSIVPEALCELPLSSSSSIGRRSSSALPQTYHRLTRNAPVALRYPSQTLISWQELHLNRCYLLFVVVRSLWPCVIEKSAPILIKLLTSSSPAPPSSTTLLNPSPALPLLNGHTSPLEAPTLTNEDAPYDSESDLSEVANPIVEEPSPAPSINHQSEFGAEDTDASESSAADVQDESDDADFDMEDSPPPAAPGGGSQDRSTSPESRRPPKRKLNAEDEHILANPELYGLRRSVRDCWL